MERLTEGGVYNAVILNLALTGPLYGPDPDDLPFLSEAWWTLFAGVCEDAETLGFRLWFYDQLGFSGANLQAELVRNSPNFSGESLESLIADGTTLSLTCPSEGQPLKAFFTTEAGETVRVALNGRTAHVTTKEAGCLRLVYSVRRGFDYFSPGRLVKPCWTPFMERLNGGWGVFSAPLSSARFRTNSPTSPVGVPTLPRRSGSVKATTF